MYDFEEDEKTGLQKTLNVANSVCAMIFSASGKTIKTVAKVLAGEPNQNGNRHREVNS